MTMPIDHKLHDSLAPVNFNAVNLIKFLIFIFLGNKRQTDLYRMPLEYNLCQPLSIWNLNTPSFHSEFKCSINISCPSKFSCSKNYGKYRYLILVFLSKKKAD